MPTHDIRFTRILHIHVLLRFLILTVRAVRVQWLALRKTPRTNEFFMIGCRWATFPNTSLNRVVLSEAYYHTDRDSNMYLTKLAVSQH